MMSIAIATPTLNAYSETFIRAHIERLPAEVHVLHGGTPPTLVDDGVPIAAPFTLREHLRWTIGRKVRGLTWADWQRYPLVRVLRDTRAQAVLAEYGHMGVSLMAACAQAEVPLIVHFHGHDAYDRSALDGPGKEYGALFEQAAAIIAVSHAMEAQLVRLGAPRGKLRHNACGVDLQLFPAGSPQAAPPTFVAVGRFVDKKAPDLTLHAFRQVVGAVPEARLEMIGDGPLWGTCQRLAEQLEITDRVSFLGVREHAEVASRMQSARAFVQHSITALSGDSEGTPVAVLEAQASGLPVVSTRHAGIPDVVLEGQTGFLVDEGDVDGMAQAMIRLAQDPNLAQSMGAAGRARVEAEFSMDKSIANLWQIIETAIEEYHR